MKKNVDKGVFPRRRCIFVTDEIWRAVGEAAKSKDRTAASWIREAIKKALSSRMYVKAF